GFAATLMMIAATALLPATAATAAEITGAGATFPYPIYAKWADAYKTKTGVAMNYQSIGSGGGIAQIKARTIDFGASDMPPGAIRLTGPVLADIYLGKIRKWNDKAIAELNAGVALPDESIAVVRRSDGSGTTFIFTDYLSKVSPEWKSRVGSSTDVAWPEGVGGKGNEGVAA